MQYASVSWLWATFSTLAGVLTAVAILGGAYQLLRPRNGNFKRYHLLAGLMVVVLIVGLVMIAYFFFPGNERGWEWPASVYLYILMTLLIWILSSLDFFLSCWHISPVFFLIVIAVLGYQFGSVDHYYSIRSPSNAGVTPTEVAKVHQGKNLVVVASSGGGILAAGWTTLALERLICARLELAKEIRILSTVSGGSVGAAYYIDGLLRHSKDEPCLNKKPVALADVFEKSTTSSLAATAYGLAFPDFWRFISGGWFPWGLSWLVPSWEDRGSLLEKDWARIAAGARDPLGNFVKATGVAQNRSLSSLSADILSGRIPAPIFNATVMEAGRRLMITPVAFQTSSFSEYTPLTAGVENTALPGRAATLTEFLAGPSGDGADVNLWTAARLSATFPYVSPAARADSFPQGVPDRHYEHHLVDGGYYDNFGVASALDWLTPVLEARLQGKDELTFQRVLIIQLRAFRKDNPRTAQPKDGAVAALLGPLVGLASIRSGVALSRNDIELKRFIESWNARFAAKKELEVRTYTWLPYAEIKTRYKPPYLGGSVSPVEVCLDTVVFEPSLEEEEGPLSWQLSEEQKRTLLNAWNKPETRKQNRGNPEANDPANWNPEIYKNWTRMVAHLNGIQCPGRTQEERGEYNAASVFHPW